MQSNCFCIPGMKLANCWYAKKLLMALLHMSHPQFRLVGERIPYIFIFPRHPESWTPLQIPLWGVPLQSVTGPQYFLWYWLKQNGYFLQVFSVLGGSFLLPLGRGQAFAGVFVDCACWHFWVASYLVLSLGYMRKQRTRGLLLCAVPWVLRSLASQAFSTFQNLLFVLCMMYIIFRCTQQEI